MLFQQLVIFLALFGLALADPEYGDSSITQYVTIQNDIYSTKYATVTSTGEPPAESPPTEEPTYSVFTSVYTSGVYPTGGPSSSSGYSNSTTSATSLPSGSNSTVTTHTISPAATGGAKALKVSSSLVLVVAAVCAVVL
ncbi:hypothetical protein BDD12DRAFT_877003 [Trichophaea hybrida]|nr:hypothetical protein BDD12DRAFT_877003 [Trichophaea hybrida]